MACDEYDMDTCYNQILIFNDLVDVRLKVNGTWLDGTTEDIVLSKRIGTTISYEDIPKDKIPKEEFESGNWDILPISAKIVDGMNEFVLTAKVIDTPKKVDENPATGVKDYIFEFIMLSALLYGMYKIINKYLKVKKSI